MASSTDDNSTLTPFGSYREYIVFLQHNKNFEWLHKYFTRERPKLLRAMNYYWTALMKRSFVKKSIANPSKTGPKAFRQESLYSLMGMSRILIGLSSTAFLMSQTQIQSSYGAIQTTISAISRIRSLHVERCTEGTNLSALSETHSLETKCDRYNSDRLLAPILKDPEPVSITTMSAWRRSLPYQA